MSGTPEEIGFPLLVKAAAGGGGRGMRVVRAEADLADALDAARREAGAAFGDDTVFCERYLERPRHVEIQLLADSHGTVLALGERECSVQRRHQKLIEETPAPQLAPATLAAAIAQVEAACGQLRYRGAGTVEMLQDDAGSLWFMEMNTRLQVEHTITEEVTGLDLVEWQLRVAANEGIAGLSVAGAPGGAAIECRINAEDVGANFRPTPGQVTRLRLPAGEGVRVDTHLREGDRISPHYDSMIAKLIAWGPDRPTAIARMLGALDGLEVEGVPTTAALHARILRHPTFASGAYDTRFLERELERLLS
jgi:acetyl-CoA carboxylase biotin carboxylase subunit